MSERKSREQIIKEGAERIRALLEEGHDKDTVLEINKNQMKKELGK